MLVTAQLTALGLDSLGFVELGGRLKKAFNIEMDSVKMSPEMTLEDVQRKRAHDERRANPGEWALVRERLAVLKGRK